MLSGGTDEGRAPPSQPYSVSLKVKKREQMFFWEEKCLVLFKKTISLILKSFSPTIFFFDQEPEGFRDSALEIPTLNSFLSVSLGTLISLKSGRRSLEPEL